MTKLARSDLERRTEPRLDVEWEAALIPGHNASIRPSGVTQCRVIDVSPGGARLRLSELRDWLPASSDTGGDVAVTLIVEAFGHLAGHVVWIEGETVGISFVGDFDVARRMELAWQEVQSV